MTVQADASRQCIAALMATHPTVVVDERFDSECVNLEVPDDVIDDVLEWFEQRKVPASIV